VQDICSYLTNRSSNGTREKPPPIAQPLATNSNLYLNVRFGSLAAHHSLHLTVRFQYEADIRQRLLSSESGHWEMETIRKNIKIHIYIILRLEGFI